MTASTRGPGRPVRREVAGDVGGDAAAEDQTLEQRVGGQPVRAVHAGAGDLAAGVEPRGRSRPFRSVATPPDA